MSSDDTMEALMSQKLCITALPNRATYSATHAATSPSTPIATCSKHRSNAGGATGSSLQIYAADVHVKSSASPLRSFTTTFTVPPLPLTKLYAGQHVFFWPGLKAEAPEMGYPVLQPVLQYGMKGPGWTLQSWFVDAARQNAVTAPAVACRAGDQISTSMTLSTDGSTWTVSGTNEASGEDSTLHIADSPVAFDYAMLVNENINVNDHCGRMPASASDGDGDGDESATSATEAITFTNVAINEEERAPNWTTRAGCAGNELCDCGNAARVAANGDVTLSWRTRAL